jgi:large subunit ribosomal protein L29
VSKQIEAVQLLRAMGGDELDEHVREQRRKLFEIRFQLTTGQVENHRQLRQLRRDVARALTLRAELARSGEARPPAPAAVTAPPEPAPRRRARRDSAASRPVVDAAPAVAVGEERSADTVAEAGPSGAADEAEGEMEEASGSGAAQAHEDEAESV